MLVIYVFVPRENSERFSESLKMSPNAHSNNMANDNVAEEPRRISSASSSTLSKTLKVVHSSLNLISHVIVGCVVGVTFIYVFRNEFPLQATPQHILLCVLGYHLLMAEAILCLSSGSSWTSSFSFVEKRRAHWILQISGSILAIVGTFIKILDKEEHWTTLHGKFALVALVFTTVSLFNGLASLWAHELRKFIPAILSKLTHICFGSVAFVSASICLCYGFDKGLFRNWATDSVANMMFTLTGSLILLVVINPMLSLYIKSTQALKR